MAISAGNILSVKFFLEQSGNQALVTSFWRIDDMVIDNTYTAYANMMAVMFQTTGRNGQLQHTTSHLRRVVVDNLTVIGEFGEWEGDIAGGITGDAMPPYVAISVKQSVETRLTRAGFKRIPFPSESTISGLTLSISAPDRTAIEDFWRGASTYVFDGTPEQDIEVEQTPVVVGRTLDLVTGEYFLDLSKINIVTDSQITKPTSQVSRKP